MAWGRLDDQFHSHPKVMEAGNEAAGVFMRLVSWCNAHTTDGFVPENVAIQFGSRRLVEKLRGVGLLDDDGPAGAYLADTKRAGWWVHDYLAYNFAKETTKLHRARNKETRDPAITAVVKHRDGDFCRYCAVQVKWSDKRGQQGATYDHIDPNLAVGAANIVIACRSCNSKKKNNKLEDVGMVLLPAPDPGLRSVPSPPSPEPSTADGRPEPDSVGQGDALGSGTGQVGVGSSTGRVPKSSRKTSA
jgi:hypothetical protein